MDKRQRPDANRNVGKRFTKGSGQGREGGDRSSQRKSSFNRDQDNSFKSSREGSHERDERKSFPPKRFSPNNDGGGEKSKDGIYAPKEYKSMRREGGSFRGKGDKEGRGFDRNSKSSDGSPHRASNSDRKDRFESGGERPRREDSDRRFSRGSDSGSRGSDRGDSRNNREERPRREDSERKFSRGSDSGSRGGDRGNFRDNREERPRREGGDFKSQERGSFNRGGSSDRPNRGDSDSRYPKREGQGSRFSSSSSDRDSDRGSYQKRQDSDRRPFDSTVKRFGPKPSSAKPGSQNDRTSQGMRLNRFIAHAGICSRREADVFIKAGLVKVNNKVVAEMGHIVGQMDEVRYNDTIIKSEKKVYLLLNKPKGFITTSDDPKARKTVMDLIVGACKERVYPIGRLDRSTSGVLLFTNDGDMTDKLLHPSQGAQKIYEVVLDKVLSRGDLQKIADGLTLEDGLAQVDGISYVDDKDKTHVGINLHIGKNRIVRRIFESLGYEVTKLDRVFFAGLTKKRLERGHWRFLTDKEVDFLKMR